MKMLWSAEALAAHWSLSDRERTLLTHRVARNRLGVAVQLKTYQFEGRFPRRPSSISPTVVAYIAQQLDVDPKDFAEYRFENRTGKRHRSEILRFLGLRRATTSDRERLATWLKAEVIAYDANTKNVIERTLRWYQKHRIEPPTDPQLDRYVRSTIRRFYDELFTAVNARLPPSTRESIDALMRHGWGRSIPTLDDESIVRFGDLKAPPGRVSVDSITKEVRKLTRIRALGLNAEMFADIPTRLIEQHARRTASATSWELQRHPEDTRNSLIAAFCWYRQRSITDALGEFLVHTPHKMKKQAEAKIHHAFLKDIRRVHGKTRLLYKMASAALTTPQGVVSSVIFPVVDEETLRALVDEYEAGTVDYDTQVFRQMRQAYAHHYRRATPLLLRTLEFRCSKVERLPIVRALSWLQAHWDDSRTHLPLRTLPVENIVPRKWRDCVIEPHGTRKKKTINRISYELCLLHVLREALKNRDIWLVGAFRYRNPADDLPPDFETHRDSHYDVLDLPGDAGAFIEGIRTTMTDALRTLDQHLPNDPDVSILERPKGAISLSPVKRQPDPPNLTQIKAEVFKRWDGTSLLDVLNETDLRTGFTSAFKPLGHHEHLSAEARRERLLLCLHGLGTNTGIKAVASRESNHTYKELLRVKRRYVDETNLRDAIASVVNATFEARSPDLWGEGTTACASDSKQFAAWDQNLMTEWHIRYGGRGVMVYWHVEKKSACIYSQLKRCSSSEVAAMIEGVLRHCTDATIDKNYVDSHGQSEVGFAFCYLLGFDLLPRLRAIGKQRLYRVSKSDEYNHIGAVTTRPIDWRLIANQYDELVKLATALRLGTGDTEAILSRFTRKNYTHPTYRALAELGKAIKTIFLCRYLSSKALRREINEGLNVVENWNSANDFIHYGKRSELASNHPEEQTVSILALQLVQSAMVYVNTLMLEDVINAKSWRAHMTADDYRALTPLIYAHLHPYGKFELEEEKRLLLASNPA